LLKPWAYLLEYFGDLCIEFVYSGISHLFIKDTMKSKVFIYITVMTVDAVQCFEAFYNINTLKIKWKTNLILLNVMTY